MKTRERLVHTVLPLFFVLAGCSLKSANNDSSLYVDLSSLKSEAARFSLLNPSGGFSSLVSAPPAAETGFSCYAVNVVGPGIGDSSSGGSPGNLGATFSALMNETSYCSYRGVVSSPVYLSGGNPQVSLQVPPGGVRLVQLIGVNDLAVCQSGVIDSPPGSNDSDPRFYEVGRAVVSDFFSDRSVDVTMNWPSGSTSIDQLARADRSIECGEGDCGYIRNYTAGGTAAQYTFASAEDRYAQPVVTVPGKYLRRVALQLQATTTGPTGVSARVEIWSSTSSVINDGANPASFTGYFKEVPLADGTNGWIDFSLYMPGNGYLQMVSGHYYWLVVYGPNVQSTPVPRSLRVGHGSNGSSSTSAGVFNGTYDPGTSATVWSPVGFTDGIYSRVYGCGN